MANFLRDLAVLLFTASEQVEKKSSEFRKIREERFKKFSRELEESKEAFLKKHEKEIGKAHEKITAAAGKIGIATKAEIDEIKKMIGEFDEKLNRILKEKK